MTPNEIQADLRKRPFEPFRLEVSDGTHYDIYHPDLCMVGLGSVTIGVTPDPAATLYAHTVKVDCRHIVKQIPLAPLTPPGANGQQPA